MITRNAFLHYIRAYATLSRRFGQSFDDVVDHLARLHIAWLAKDGMTVYELLEEKDAIQDMVTREYGGADKESTPIEWQVTQ